MSAKECYDLQTEMQMDGVTEWETDFMQLPDTSPVSTPPL